MKWYTIEWFGGFKTECEECGRYAVGDSIKDARNALRAHLVDYSNPYCGSCTHEMQVESEDNVDLSMSNQLRFLKAENQRLKEAILPWKDAWFHCRDII